MHLLLAAFLGVKPAGAAPSKSEALNDPSELAALMAMGRAD